MSFALYIEGLPEIIVSGDFGKGNEENILRRGYREWSYIL